MHHQLLASLADILGEEISGFTSVSGGDISQAYFLLTQRRKVFLKLNTSATGLKMFEAEKKGLLAIGATQTIHVPQVYYCGVVMSTAALLLEYVETKRATEKDLELLGHQVARLHQTTSETFGWDTDNFIGRLAQYNHHEQDWTTFYVTHRLLPQLRMACDTGMLTVAETPAENVMYKTLQEILPPVKPGLLHGDLWGGNYIISTDGIPYLIDPAVYYGHHEVDLAMSRLFGGFGSRYYHAYGEIIPAAPQADIRNDLYQLYYLLVHLNMFGRGYYPQVSGLMKQLFWQG